MNSIVYSGKEKFEITGFRLEPDIEDGRIFLRLSFEDGKGIEWIGFTPHHAVSIGNQLIKAGKTQIGRDLI